MCLAIKEAILKQNCTYLYIIIITALICGCTAKHIYGAGQSWQRQQCYTMPNQTESNECLNKANTSYDDYKYKTGKIKK
jgi:hypothetical protein